MVDLLNVARDIAKGCQYLEENQFIHRYLTDGCTFCIRLCKNKFALAKINGAYYYERIQ